MQTYRTALVTGASSGIGAALARRFAADGAHVVIAARRASELEALAADIARGGGTAKVLPLDVADPARTVAAIRAVDAELGGLDLIVANAGVGGVNDGRKLTWEDVATMLQVNFNGAVATLTAVLPRMLERGRGHLVGVSSLAAIAPLPRSAPYAATKAGLSMFLECLRLDLLDTGVRVTCVHPGFVRTPMTDKNAFPMPFMLECDAAVDLIATRLPDAPATIDFPLPLLAGVRAVARMPRPLRDFASKRQTLVR